MSWLDTVASLLLPPVEPIQTRVSEFPSFDEQLAIIQRRSSGPKAWVSPSVDEALGVPAVFSAVTLIASTMGTLSMEAFRNNLLLPADERPSLVVRPNPLSTPYAFFFLSAFYKATRGERWWWVAKRDTDGQALSLYPVPPWEITVAQNDQNRLRPTITWGNKVMPNEDMIQDIWFPDHSGLRGVGPLQRAGAAVSVAVESQEWAANFYSGSLPSIIGTTDQDMSEGELKEMDKQWLEKPSNMPRWLTNGLTLSESPIDPAKAQLTESRQHQVGEVARMFLMPGPLLEYQMSGSSLTYRTESGIWLDFRQRCLGPIFAEPMEQQLSDLLTRTTTARFNYDQLLRSDIKTRYEAYQIGVTAGFLSSDEVRRQEGLSPGAVDYAPVPLAPPQATPTLLPINRSAAEVRCAKCHRMLAEAATPPYRMTCPRCKTVAAHDGPVDDEERAQLRAIMLRGPQPSPVTVENHPPNITIEPRFVFERGAFQVDAVDLRPIGESMSQVAEHQPLPMTIEMKHPDIEALAESVEKLATRPVEVTTDGDKFAGALIDLKAELSRRKEIVRDPDGRIVAVK